MELDPDEDYEISNPMNRAQFEETKEEGLLNLNQDFRSESKISSTEKNDTSQKLKFHFLSSFINTKSSLVKNNTSILNELLVEMDLSIVIDNYLNFIDTLDNSKNSSNFDRLFFMKIFQNFLIFYLLAYLFLSVLFGVSLYLFPFFILASFFIYFFYFRMFELFFKSFILFLKNYLSLLKKLVYQLKEMEMVRLASKRRLFVETNVIKPELSYENDAIRPYRKHVFHRLRHQFFDLKKINQSINLANLNCICSINTKDLSEIMWQEKDDELELLTDFFSINCIKSLMKLILLLVSENLKLILLNYYDLVLIDSNIVKIIYHLARFGFKLVLEAFLIRKLIKDLKHSSEIIKLTNSDNVLSKIINKPVSLEHKLILHLRNAILNASELEKIGENNTSLKAEILSLLKYDFEHSNIYLKQLICNIEGPPLQSSIKKIDLSETQRIDSNLESSHLNSIHVDEEVVDQIFEADTFNLKDLEKKKYETEETEECLKEKQNLLTNKNLFYELKYALKTKKNEWIEREKAARKITEKNSKESLEHKDDFDGFHLNQNHLLENEALKYKSELRRRKSSRNPSAPKKFPDTQVDEKKSKYKYEEFKEDSQSDEKNTNFILNPTKNQPSFLSDSVLNEFMLKRNLVMKKLENEEEEISFE